MTRMISLLAITAGLCITPAQAASWHQGFCLGNGDTWRSRLPIEVRNATGREVKGEPVRVAVGRGPQQADLVGAQVEALRVCNDAGLEMLYNVVGPDGEEVHAGPIADGSQLVIPAECAAGDPAAGDPAAGDPAAGDPAAGDPAAGNTAAGNTARYWAYFDNPAAWGVPDFLAANVGIRNGGFEDGGGTRPAAWRSDTTDPQHRISWVRENPRSGKRCMQTMVDPGAPSTWVATRQGSLPITGGARYVMRAWVKAQDVVGDAGWYIHVGNPQNAMLIAPMLSGGAGTQGWKEVVAEFTAPADADLADLGTVLYGTGTAWFDDVSLECLDPARLSATAGPRESLAFTQSGADATWYDDDSADVRAWDYRIPVRVANYSDTPAATGLISVDLAGILARLRGRADRDSLRTVLDGRVVKSYQLKDLLLIEGEPVAPRTVQIYYLYIAESERSKPAGASAGASENFTTDAANPALPGAPTKGPQVGGGPDYEALLDSPSNLVRNPSFEIGDTLPADWPGGMEGERPAAAQMSLTKPGLFGERCARISVPHGSPSTWFGWRQSVPVKPGKSYLYAAWLKCEDLRGGLQLHAHFRNAAGEYCEKAETTGAGHSL
ncbi:MAG: carbohydrate binding domain-containing protein [Pirellulaceae bacterium]